MAKINPKNGQILSQGTTLKFPVFWHDKIDLSTVPNSPSWGKCRNSTFSTIASSQIFKSDISGPL